MSVEDRVVTVRAWRYDLKGRSGHVVPIYLLDTDLDGNSGWDRGLTDHLYGGDTNYRLQQEIVLGMGGSRMAHALGYRVNVYHMNEGHAALLTLALLESAVGRRTAGRSTEADMDQVRRKCVFTTHTPVPAGHDRFSTEQSIRILGGDRTARLEKLGCFRDGMLNMTLLALRFSRYANGVAMQHGKVSREMFPEFTIDSITNGVHAPTWVSEPMQQMLDEHIPAWRRDNLYLRNAIDLPETGDSRQRMPAPKRRCWPKSPRAPARCSIPRCSRWALPAAPPPTSAPTCSSPIPSGCWRLPPRPAACRFSTPARLIPRTSPARR